jgi:hypothetical protein
MAEYYGTWKSDEVVCDKCGWKGRGEECEQGEMFEELFELNCPSCSKRLFVVTYPTIEESRQNWDKLSEADKRMVEERERFLQLAENSCLKSADQLPDIAGDDLVFVWDQSREDLTLIRYGDRIVWKEPAYYEGYERFVEVVSILHEKYGSRIKDLVPTLRSMNYLYGDRISAPRTVDDARSKLWSLML